MNNKRIKAIICLVLVILMIAAIIVPVLTTTFAGAADLKTRLTELRKDANSLAEQQKEQRSKINALTGQIGDIMNKKALIDYQIQLTEMEIDNVNEQLIVISEEVKVIEAEYADVLADEVSQIEIFKERVRAMEENGSISYYEILFQAKDFSDLLSRLDFISEIMAYDESVVERLEAAKAKSEAKKVELEEIYAEVEAYKTLQLEKVAEREAQRTEAEQLIIQLDEEREDECELLAQMAEERAKIDAEIAEAVAEIARQEAAAAAARLAAINSTGTYMWPSTATHITSGFGPRTSPTAGASTNHPGVDVGAAYGSKVFAADSGEITRAEYSSSYGNYIMINHGKGRVTLYAHMSKLAVKQGDTVKQGDVIGYVGSTGISTGPHLHFETYSGGVRVDPLSYFPGLRAP
jgi:murein DD-endopeptidase MepM/ murein hydrolase activator NlpD